MVGNGRRAGQLTWDRYLEPIDVLLGVPSGAAGASAPFATALAGWQSAHQLHVDGIRGPDTWTVMWRALAPPDSLTGVVPAAMPPVPNAFDEIIGTFGDSRSLLEPDGTITSTSLARWERRILAPCPLAFPLAVGGARQTIRWFQCHRRLVGVFEAAFDELGRRGLEGAIKTWDGVFAFRAMRGDTHLSVHTFGAAIDLNAATIPLGGPGDMDPGAVAVFRHFGFL
jgi:hypothetical protein